MASVFTEILQSSTINMTNYPPTVANSDAVRILSSISASLSIVGTIAIIATYFLWKEIQTNSRLILVYISLADFFTAAGNLVTIFDTKGLKKPRDTKCVIQSYITTTSCLCSFFWTTYLGLYLFLTVARKQLRMADNLMLVFHITAWGIPLAIVTTALVEHKLGDDFDYVTVGWCWINHEARNKTFWMLITGKAWEIGSYFLITILFIIVKCHIRSEIYNRRQMFITNSSLVAAQKADRKLSFVPLAFVLLRIWGTVRFIIFISFPSYADHKDLRFLIYLQGIGDLGQGFANFLLFCFLTDKFQVRFKKLLRSQCCHRFRGSKQNPHQRQVVQSRVTKPSAAQPIRKQTSKNLAGCNETSPLLQGSNTNTASPPRSP